MVRARIRDAGSTRPSFDLATLLRARATTCNPELLSCSQALLERRLFGAASARAHVAGATFEIVRRLGAGSTGVVYEVKRPGERVSLALKLLQRAGADEAQRLQHEFRTLRDLHHPNLVRLHELFVADESAAFTMELVAGVDLLAHVQPQNRLDLARHNRAFCGLARGLCALHEAGIVHRDLKPCNVLVTHAGRVVVLDFGVSLSALCEEREVAGTAGFMAPEQLRGESTFASDLFAVGVMLSLALFGTTRPPPCSSARLAPYLQLVRQLCAERPEHRPTARALLAWLTSRELRACDV